MGEMHLDGDETALYFAELFSVLYKKRGDALPHILEDQWAEGQVSGRKMRRKLSYLLELAGPKNES